MNPKSNYVARLLRALAVGSFGLLLVQGAAPVANAAALTWNGGGNQVTWSDPNNWGGTAPVVGDSLFFDGTTGLVPQNDYTAGTVFSNVTFNPGAGAFVLIGNSFNLGGNITNLSGVQQTVSNNINMPVTGIFNALSNDMRFTGMLANNTLQKEGPGTVILSGIVNNGNLRGVLNAGTLVLSNTVGEALGSPSSTSFSTTVSNGVLVIAGPSTDQMHFNQRLIMYGGICQLQNTFEEIASISGSNSFNAIVENGRANTTNRFDFGGGSGHRGIFAGTFRDGAAGVLSLRVYRNNNQQVLRGTNTYTGLTTVDNATGAGVTRLIFDGLHTGGGNYAVTSTRTAPDGSSLGGSGIISASNVTVGSASGSAYTELAPGGQLSADLVDSAVYSDTTAILTFSNNVTLNLPTTALRLELNGNTPGVGYDQVAIEGAGIFSNNNANLVITLNYTPANGDQFTIVKVHDTDSTNTVGVFTSLNGTLTDLSQGATFVDTTSGQSFKISYRAEGTTFDAGAGNGNNIMLQAVAPIVGQTLTWRGNGTDNNWDLGGTADFFNGTSLTTFNNTDSVTFDDTGSNNIPVNLIGDLNPSIVLFNASSNYVLAGSGRLTGTISITKTNTGTVSIVTDNNNIGSTIIRAGTLQIGTNGTTGTASGTLAVLTNGTLAYNRSDDTFLSSAISGNGVFVHNGTGMLTINTTLGFTGKTTNSGGILQFGDGSSGAGSISGVVAVNAGKVVNYLYGASDVNINNALAGNGTVNIENTGGNTTVNMPSSLASSNFTGTINVVGFTRVHAPDNNVGFNLGNGSTVNVLSSQVWLDRSGTPYNNIFNVAGTGYAGDAIQTGVLRIFGCTLNGAINMQADSRIGGTINGGTILCPISGPYQLEVWGNAGSFILSMGPTNGLHSYASTLIRSGSISALNSNAISKGPMTLDVAGDLRLNGNNLSVSNLTSIASGLVTGAGATVQNINATNAATLTVGADNTSTSFDGIFLNGGAAALGLAKIGSGTFTLSGNSTNTGAVTVTGGTLALIGAGSFGKASQIIAGSGATYDVTGSGGTLTLNSGQTVGGNGTVNGAVVSPAGSTVAPGLPMGTLTVSASATINGVYRANLNRNSAPNCSKLTATGGTTISGATLSVTNVGPRLQVGDFFQLFPGATAGFTGFTPQVNDAANNAVYTWNNTVSSDGRVTVASVTDLVNPSPTNIVVGVTNGTSLTLSWPADHTGWTLQAQTNSAANKGLGTNWSNVTGSAATNLVIIPINPTNGSVFFRMKF